MQREFTFKEFLGQMTQVSRLGQAPAALSRRLGLPEVDLDAQVRRLRAIFCSMTAWERENPDQLNANRRRRIAAGAGVGILEVS